MNKIVDQILTQGFRDITFQPSPAENVLCWNIFGRHYSSTCRQHIGCVLSDGIKIFYSRIDTGLRYNAEEPLP